MTKMQKRNSNVAGRAACGGVGRNNLDMPIAKDEVTPPDAAKPAAEASEADPAPADADAPDADADAPRNSFKKKRGAPRSAIRTHAWAVGEPKKKRGPPRPHRRLAQEVLVARIGKLQKRINKARGLLEEAERHIEAYSHEEKYRAAEAKEADA